MNINQRKAGLVMLISDKVDCRAKKITRYRVGLNDIRANSLKKKKKNCSKLCIHKKTELQSRLSKNWQNRKEKQTYHNYIWGLQQASLSNW